MTDTGTEVSLLPDPLRAALEAYKEEYRDLSETWRHLDGKAQGAVATAGIFLAAAFAFVRSFTEDQIPVESRPALVIAILLLVSSVVLAVLALRIREVAAAPLGDRLEELTNDLMRVEDHEQRRARAPDFVREQIAMWRAVNEDVRGENDRKANLVLASQVVLLLAVVSIASLTIVLIKGWI